MPWVVLVIFYFLFSIFYNQAYAADIIPPTTLTSILGTGGQNGWYITPTMVTLSATDAEAGVKSINWKVNSGSWQSQNFEATASASSFFTIYTGGSNTLNYFSTDHLDNLEATKSAIIKIDTTPPGNWNSLATQEVGNDHTLLTSINVSDSDSGLDVNSGQYQYSLDVGVTWGHYPNPTSCSGTWQTDQWLTATVNTTLEDITSQVTDFCNSRWNECKKVRLKVKDLAGNESVRDTCLNSPWLIAGGDVGAYQYISMQSLGTMPGAIGVISAGDYVTNFSSGLGAVVTGYSFSSPLPDFTYWEKYLTIPTIVSSLPTTTGVFRINGDFVIDNLSIPNDITSKTFNAVVIVDGNIDIDNDLIIGANSSLIFIVSGNLFAKKQVTRVDGSFVVNGSFTSPADDPMKAKALLFNGTAAASSFALNRSLTGDDNKTRAAETFAPNYRIFIDQLPNINKLYRVTWREVD